MQHALQFMRIAVGSEMQKLRVECFAAALPEGFAAALTSANNFGIELLKI